MITINITPEVFLIILIIVGLLLVFAASFWPSKKTVSKKTKTRSPKEIARIKRDIKRMEKMLK